MHWLRIAALSAATLILTTLATSAPAAAAIDPQGADLVVSMRASANPVPAGGTLTYTLNVANTVGHETACDPEWRPRCRQINVGAPASGVVVQDTLPGGVIFQSVSASAGGFACSAAGQLVTCSGGSLAIGGSAIINITVTVPNLGTTLVNVATVDPGQTIDERSYANNTASVSTTVSPRPANGSMNPGYVWWPFQGTGTTSGGQSTTLTNTGELPLSINSRTTTSTEFAETDTCASSVAPGASCTLTFTFTPSAAGFRNAYFIVFDNAPYGASGLSCSCSSVYLEGMGYGPNPQLSTNQIDFGTQQVNVASAPHRVTLTNGGAGVLNISSITAGSADPSSVSFNIVTAPGGTPCPAAGGTLTGFASCTIDVTFVPHTSTGQESGALTVSDNAGTQSVNLLGVGAYPSLTMSMTQAPTPATRGGQVTYTITIQNVGSVAWTSPQVRWATGPLGFTATDLQVVSCQGPAGWTCYAGSSNSWETDFINGTLPAGASGTFTIVVRLPNYDGGYSSAAQAINPYSGQSLAVTPLQSTAW